MPPATEKLLVAIAAKKILRSFKIYNKNINSKFKVISKNGCKPERPAWPC